MFGIFTHPLIHSSFKHLLTNTLPLFFLSWCLFYFYRSIAPSIFLIIWIGCGAITFLIGKPAWHIGASGIIYGLAFFLFFSGLLRKYIPLIAISLFYTIRHFVGRAFKRSYHRYHLCFFFYGLRPAKAGPFRK